ncbi:hypothetical protein EG830_06350, partial [bacterium]|nr:hypothetical protein [bacterium]
MMNRFKRLLIFLNNRRIRRLLKLKIEHIRKNVSFQTEAVTVPDHEIRMQHNKLWSEFPVKINHDWLDVYTAVSSIIDYRYVPEDIYYTEIEPRLNNKLFSKAWTDKNSYELHIGQKVKTPEVVLRCINGILYSPDFIPLGKPENYNSLPADFERRKLIIKPTMDSGGGKSVRVIACSGSSLEVTPPAVGINSISGLFSLYGGNFVVQTYIKQHPYFEQFNESSLNTVRVFTYRSVKDEKVSVLHRLLRAGRPGSVVDNQASGGIACAIHQDGRLALFGVDKGGLRHKGTASADFCDAAIVPFIDEICKAAVEVASCYRYSRLLGLDFAVDV